MNIAKIKDLLTELEIELTPTMLKQFDEYANFLIDYNQKVNLTAITDYDEIFTKHFYDSLLTLKLIKIDNKLADIGTGAGFPGVVLKIVRPDIDLYLIEANGKRCEFLKELLTKLELSATIINKRAEELNDYKEYFDFVCARAVAPLNILLELLTPLAKINAKLLILRGKNGKEELLACNKAFKELNLELIKINTEHYDDNTRINALINKKNKTHHKYPRNYSQIKRKPL